MDESRERSDPLCVLRFRCAHSAEPVGHGDLGQTGSTAEAQGSTLYRIGDFVEYRYSGSFSSAPVRLVEEVTEQPGSRLTLTVTASRGQEEMKWVQVVTDTVENQKAEKIDELYLVEDGVRRKLGNAGNRDIYRSSRSPTVPSSCGPMVRPPW